MARTGQGSGRRSARSQFTAREASNSDQSEVDSNDSGASSDSSSPPASRKMTRAGSRRADRPNHSANTSQTPASNGTGASSAARRQSATAKENTAQSARSRRASGRRNTAELVVKSTSDSRGAARRRDSRVNSVSRRQSTNSRQSSTGTASESSNSSDAENSEDESDIVDVTTEPSALVNDTGESVPASADVSDAPDSDQDTGDSEGDSDESDSSNEEAGRGPAQRGGSARGRARNGSPNGTRSGSDSSRSNGSASNGSRRTSRAEKSADPRTKGYFVKDIDVKAWRRQEALSRFRYLLSLGDLFRQFVDYKAQNDPEFKEILDEAMYENKAAARAAARSSFGGRGRQSRRNKAKTSLDISEVEEYMEEPDEEEPITVFSESPGFVKGTLRQYQIDGLNWLVSLFVNSINGILADEMGLGKTFQCISFLGYLRHIQNIRGPHLVIVPKSTVQNWAREFAKWTPDVDVLVLTGDKQERFDIIKKRMLTAKFDVCVTSFELVIREKSSLQKIAWQYVIVDEAHRIKNEESILSRIMRVLFSRHRLLITGTPLQNNLHELWALLNFLLPDVFSDADVFDEWFTQSDEQGQDKVIDQLRSLLSPFLMRRVKRDVEQALLPKKEINLYVGMTDMQIEWYQRLLEKDLDAVNNTTKGGAAKEGKLRLLNVVMQLRKCCNHPYLFDGAEPGPPFTTDEHLVYNSGKMIFMDKLLGRLKAQGSRVLIFSQMGRMLDIFEDYCSLRDYEYCRIDGSTLHEDRIAAIDEFNKPGSDKFIFLLTTRAGGLGINLTTADQVIIYDSDWNPQADLQAMDRAHRIGQTKQVYVYRFVVEHAIEEKVIERAAQKLRLDQLVIQQSGSNRNSAQEKAKAAASKEELANMIRHGAQKVFDQKKGNIATNMSIEDLINAGEKRTKELNDKYSELGLDELKKFTFDKPPTQAPIVNRNAKQEKDDGYYHHRRRTRHQTLYLEETGSAETERGSRGAKQGVIRAPKQLPLHDFQFFPKGLQELQQKELAWYRNQAGIRLSPEDYSSDEDDESEARNEEIENAQPLTDEELALKEKLISEGFPNFSKRDFYHFLNLVIKHGGSRNMTESKLDEMSQSWPEKDPEEVKRYHKVFFERYHEINDHERYMNQLEAGESKARKQNLQTDLLRKKVESSRTPLSGMAVTQPGGGSASRHRFTEANDRFLIVQMFKIGLDHPNLHEKIRDSIRTSGIFDFDWYFMSRTTTELARRCTSLLTIIVKELDGPSSSGRGGKRKGRPPLSGVHKELTVDSEEESASKRLKDGSHA